MGSSESKEKLGQRVVIAKSKFERDLSTARQRYEYLKQNASHTLTTMMESVSASFATYSPFVESTLLIAWLSDADQCTDIVLSACKKVLRSPIDNSKYEWFNQYVFGSNIWMCKSENSGKYMYEELLAIGNAMSSSIVTNMDAIYEHLQSHKQWEQVLAIENQTLIARQDHKSVGLLSEKGLREVFDREVKSDEENSDDIDMKNFIDSNMAINMLTSTASKIDDEFQRHVRIAMSSYGSFKKAPMKKVERSVSKLENEYRTESFPKSAKLLDLVRCSVTFNTVEQLLTGYSAFMRHIKANPSIIELARVKNGFIKMNRGGYRDIKINVVYKSQNPEHRHVHMVCEVQLLLINYLEEKRKIHKLYSILREETFFNMVVSKSTEINPDDLDMKTLNFTDALNVGREVKLSYQGSGINKCSVDTELNVLGIEAHHWFGVVDFKSKRQIWSLDRETSNGGGRHNFGFHTHQWLTIGTQKYLSVQTKGNQIKMFKVVKTEQSSTKMKMFKAINWKGNTGVGGYQFIADPKYELTFPSDGRSTTTIHFCDFDFDFKHIFLICDQCELQKRAVHDINTVVQSITLEEKVSGSVVRNFRLSADGKYCVLAGGRGRKYFYVIDIENETQIKLESEFYLNSSYVPCFINGENELVAVGDRNGRIEIWDFKKQECVKKWKIEGATGIYASASTHNILGIGSFDKTLRLYDVRSWEMFYERKFACDGESLNLTDDMKYITFAGRDDAKKDRCVVLEIEH